jgi:cell division protein FtsZ
MPLAEIEDAIGMIEGESDDNADIIWGNVIIPEMKDEITVTVIATGFDTAVPSAVPHPRAFEANANGHLSGPILQSELQRDEEDINVPTFIRRQAD